MTALLRDRGRAALVFTATIAGAVQLLIVSSLRDQGHFAKYTWFADEILAGRAHTERIGDLSPGYLGFILVTRMLGFEYEATRGVQIGMIAVAAILCAFAAIRFVPRKFAWVVLLVLLGSRGVLLNATELEPETLILLLNAAAIFFLARENPSTAETIAGGVALGLSAVTRPVALMWIVLTVIAFAARRDWRRRAFLVAVASLLPIAAVVATNWKLSRTLAIMDPGTVFYEGWNPLASGYAGVQPRIVNDLERTIEEPDALHVTYRLVASRDRRRELSREQSNEFWRGKAIAFIKDHPFAAAELGARKLWFTAHAHDAHDLITMWRKERELRVPFITFSVALLLALFGLMRLPLPFAVRAFLVANLISYGGALLLFYVTIRQRNALYPLLAFGAACGVAALVASWRSQPRTSTLLVVLLLVSAATLHLPNGWTSEESHGWKGRSEVEKLTQAAAREPQRAPLAMALAATFDGDRARRVPRELLHRAAVERLRRAESNSDHFDAALAFLRSGDADAADTIIRTLDRNGFAPHRETRAVSSLAYYRAIIALRRGNSAAAELISKAVEGAPGDADVLALQAAFNPRSPVSRAGAYHDRFTVALAELRAAALARPNSYAPSESAAATLRQFPEWRRASEALNRPAAPPMTQ